LATYLRSFKEAGGVTGYLSLSEFIATAFEGDWPEGAGALDIEPDKVLVDAEKGGLYVLET